MARNTDLPCVDVLVTDVMMPGMGGRALAEHMLLSRPNMKVIYVSGYTSDDVLRHGVSEDRVVFLQKPYTADQLASIVRSALER
jgi:DNA-binding NtrC family response regulator